MERSNDPRGRRQNRKRQEQRLQALIAALLLSTASGCATIEYEAPVVNARPARPAAVVYVQRGDTLPAIARRYNVAAQAIIETNGLAAPYTLSRGQRLVIPPAYVAETWREQPPPRPRKPVQASYNGAFSAAESKPVARVQAEPLVAPKPVRAPTEEVESTLDPRLEGARFYALGMPREKPAFEAQGTLEETPAQSLSEAAFVLPRPKPKLDAAERDLDAPYVPPKKTRQAGRDTDLVYDEKPKPKRQIADADDERSTGRFIWPVRGKVVSNFGRRGSGVHNDGINIAADPNTPVKAADAGTVIYAGNELAGYGNLLLVRHANGFVTAYAHNKKLLVDRGDRVKQGETVALVGATGDVDRPQLHFEIRKGDRAVDPNRHLIRETASR
jgi:murein DD-endopeptidase MepM/ murein hydrolase activator NlpD